MASEPVLTEHQAGVTTRWFCNPPPKGWIFQVTNQVWSTDYSVRDIYAWQRRTRKLQKSREREVPLYIVNCGDFKLHVSRDIT